MAISLVASTGGVCLLPLYAQKLLPKTVVSRPIQGAPPMVDLVVGYNEANTSPLLKLFPHRIAPSIVVGAPARRTCADGSSVAFDG